MVARDRDNQTVDGIHENESYRSGLFFYTLISFH